jgi:hypothetical protein
LSSVHHALPKGVHGQAQYITDQSANLYNLEKIGVLDQSVAHLESLLLKYSTRIEWQDLADELLGTVDAVLKTQGAAQQVAIDKLRAVRNALKKTKESGGRK